MHERHDFSDRLSPFLVKELRAGLRTRGYQAIFLVSLTGLTVFGILSLNTPELVDETAGVIHGTLFTLLAVIMPFLSLDAIAAERRGKKLEPLILSPLTGRNVVHGKWIIAALQSAMLAAIVTPFLVLRYFSGGADIVADLGLTLIAFSAGLVGNAFMLCASGLLRENHGALNALVKVVATLMMLYGGGIASAMFMAIGFLDRFNTAAIAPFVLLGALFAAFVLLEIAALMLGSNFGSPMWKSGGGVPPPVPASARRRDASATPGSHAP